MAELQAPAVIFDLLAATLPVALRSHLLIVGSLAAAYHHRNSLRGGTVRTKDADVIVQPAGAIKECREIALRLLEEGWRRRTDPNKFPPRPTPDGSLPAIRLSPPDTDAYFVELLAFPEAEQSALQEWVPIKLNDGWYGLPSFRFLGLTMHGRLLAECGLSYADPAMMALSNLLSHPTVGEQRVESETFAGRSILRSAKDLGRVLALARLISVDEIEGWAAVWDQALRATFPSEYRQLAARAGDGLRELVARPDAIEDACTALEVGLLQGFNVGAENVRGIAQQVIGLALDPLSRLADR